MKVCPKCKIEKDETEYHNDTTRKDGHHYWCKVCVNLKNKEWRINNVGKLDDYYKEYRLKNKEKARISGIVHRLRGYGITIEQRDKMIEEQDGRCSICKNIFDTNTKNVCVDHDHITGRVRGILCQDCNKGLGYFKDSVNFLTSAIEYLNKGEVCQCH